MARLIGVGLASIAFCVGFTELWLWRWNHEMVRVYDFPPLARWVAYAVAGVLWVVYGAVARGRR